MWNKHASTALLCWTGKLCEVKGPSSRPTPLSVSFPKSSLVLKKSLSNPRVVQQRERTRRHLEGNVFLSQKKMQKGNLTFCLPAKSKLLRSMQKFYGLQIFSAKDSRYVFKVKVFIMSKGKQWMQSTVCALAYVHLHSSIFSHPTCPLFPITAAFQNLWNEGPFWSSSLRG